ncbi:DUF3352 domain-containing protein [Thermosynechococcaceae cyanobacterium BACA0444]|uniref:DUF3352 domain-containing protein n=1 Tax=Pseudocalidococcus azoricus BACA0444 TaxID=2918990 RepID=A0AAE4FP81_9CYAN|nr:DUF3352 domain-containing protein [Pseudocalidococcus azoricus]MDS3859178.1 DUF3352 domain-containing protein [Pseudocalidococcus azoricus BACA0444]
MARLAKKNPRSLAWIAGGMVLVGVAGAGIWWWQTQAKLGQLPDGVTLIPESALYTVTVTTEAPPWQLIQAAGLFQSQAWLRGPWGPVSPEGIKIGDLDFTRDILPWLGAQATFTGLPITPTTALQSSDSPVVWILPIPDQAKIEPFLNTLQQQTSREYKGIPIYNVPGPVGEVAGQGITLITQGQKQYLAWSNINAALEQIIDTAQGQPALAQVSRYQDTVIATGGGRPQAQFYLNIPAYTAQNSPSPAPAESELAGLTAALRIQDNQLRIKAMTWLPETSDRSLVAETNVSQIPQKLPGNTLATFTTSNFQASWQNAPLDWQNSISQGFQQLSGLNLEQDVLPWLKGEFALAIVPVPNARLNVVGLVVMAQTKDRPKAVATLEKLDQTAQQRAWQVTKDTEKQTTTWTMPPGIPLGQHGWLDQDTLFIALGPNLAQTLFPPPNPPLGQAPLFRSTLPNPGSSQLFVDFNRTFSLTQNSPILPQLAPPFQQALQPFQGLGIAGRVRNSWSQEYEIRLNLNNP